MTEIIIRDGYFNLTVDGRQGDSLTIRDYRKATELLQEALRVAINDRETRAYCDGYEGKLGREHTDDEQDV